MKPLDSKTLDCFWADADAREERLREVIGERLAEAPPPVIEGQIVAVYFLALRTMKLEAAAKEISYHSTSGIKDPPKGSLLEACTATTVAVDVFDSTGRIGLLQMAFPLKMLLHPDGGLTSTDILHTVAGPTIFDIYERQDARLVSLRLPESVIRAFPGPAYGPQGLRAMTGWPSDQPAFGTILKPTAGITPEQVGRLVGDAARCRLFMFIKEDENLYPDLDYSPVGRRVRLAEEAIERAKDQRGGLGLIFAPHITSAPHQMLDSLHAALGAGAKGVMFSEMFAEGTVRMVREATKDLPDPPAIYGHNAGIGVKTRCIWREVIDLLARLDGIDFRQTAPVKPGTPFLRPYGAEWRASEDVLSCPLPGIKPTMIARAGALDQGNICLNLADVESRGLMQGVLFLAGSAINSIKNAAGRYDPALGAQAMMEAIEVHRSGEICDVPMEEHLRALTSLAERRKLAALREALRQRYPGVCD
jgi:ribulose-bisphosphate carboxylase large chain